MGYLEAYSRVLRPGAPGAPGAPGGESGEGPEGPGEGVGDLIDDGTA